MRIGSWLVGLFGMSLILAENPASAALSGFAPGTLIIPMDACYQAAPDQVHPTTCLDGRVVKTDGVLRAYGLVYTLLRKGIPVHVAIDPAKASVDATDFTITIATAPVPIRAFDPATGNEWAFTPQPTIHYRGAPFLIDAADAARARDALRNDPELLAFRGTAIHVAAESFVAPIAQSLPMSLPRLALVDVCEGAPSCLRGGPQGSEGIPLMQTYLRRAGLSEEATQVGRFESPGLVGDVVTLGDVVDRDALRVGRYQIAWLPHYHAPKWNGTDYEVATLDRSMLSKLTEFVRAGGVLVAQCAAIFSLEGGQDALYRRYAPKTHLWGAESGNFLFSDGLGGILNHAGPCYPGNGAGFAGPSSCIGPLPPLAAPPGSSLAFDDPANPLVQIGDFRFYAGLSVPHNLNVDGHVGTWDVSPTNDWNAGVLHLIRTSDVDRTKDRADLLSLVRTGAGQVLYLGGHSYAEPDQFSTAGSRLVLGTLLFGSPQRDIREQARSEPIVFKTPEAERIYQGTYREGQGPVPVYQRAGDEKTWSFPHVLGHFREYPATRYPAVSREVLGGIGENWDAARRLPAGTSRRILTQVQKTAPFSLIPFQSENRGLLLPYLGLSEGATEEDAGPLINLVRASPLGGIDHSTVAIVPPSGLIPRGASRPTMAYVGALDGQLHAFVVSGGDQKPGSELWSFLPIGQLWRLHDNRAGVDGNPQVRDLFDDWEGNGRRSWRTYLAIPEGSYGRSVSVLDISDPTEPHLRWQRGPYQWPDVPLGHARGATFAMVVHPDTGLFAQLLVASGQVNAPGVQLTAFAARDGRTLWNFTAAYTQTVPGSGAIIPSEMPGAPAVVDTSGGGTEDRAYFGDLQGRIWELSLATGQNLLGAPLYDVGLTMQGHVQPIGAPLAVYRDAQTHHLVVLAATGGADFAAPTDTYGLYAIDTEALDATTGRRGKLLFQVPLAGRVYAAPTVADNDVYVLLSTGSLAGTIGATLGDRGTLVRVNLSSHRVSASYDVGKGVGAFHLRADGSLIGASVRDQIALTNRDRDQRKTSLWTRMALSFRAWLEPL